MVVPFDVSFLLTKGGCERSGVPREKIKETCLSPDIES